MASLIQTIRRTTTIEELLRFLQQVINTRSNDFYRSRVSLETIYNYTDLSMLVNLALHPTLDRVTPTQFITFCPGLNYALGTMLLDRTPNTRELNRVQFRLYNCANNPDAYTHYKERIQAAHQYENNDAEPLKSSIHTHVFLRADGSEMPVEYILYRSADVMIAITSVYNSEIADVLFGIMAQDYIANYTTNEDSNYAAILNELITVTLSNLDSTDAVQKLQNYFLETLIVAKRTRSIELLQQEIQAFSKVRLDLSTRFDNEIHRLKTSIAQKQSDIDALYRSLNNTMVNKLKAMATTEDDTIINFTRLLQNMVDKGVVQWIDYSTHTGNLAWIKLILETEVSYWEEDEAQTYLKYLERAGRDSTTITIFKKIFIDREIKLYTRTGIIFHLENPNVSVFDDFTTPLTATAHPYSLSRHPHVGWYNCFGDNGPTIKSCLMDNDLAGALGYAMSALTQMNLSDYTVTSALLRSITGADSRGEYGVRDNKSLEYKGVMLTGKSLCDVIETELHGSIPINEGGQQ